MRLTVLTTMLAIQAGVAPAQDNDAVLKLMERSSQQMIRLTNAMRSGDVAQCKHECKEYIRINEQLISEGKRLNVDVSSYERNLREYQRDGCGCTAAPQPQTTASACQQCEAQVAHFYEGQIASLQADAGNIAESYRLAYCLTSCFLFNCSRYCERQAGWREIETAYKEQMQSNLQQLRNLGGSIQECGCSRIAISVKQPVNGQEVKNAGVPRGEQSGYSSQGNGRNSHAGLREQRRVAKPNESIDERLSALESRRRGSQPKAVEYVEPGSPEAAFKEKEAEARAKYEEAKRNMALDFELAASSVKYKRMNCSKPTDITDLRGVKFTGARSIHSFEGMMPWSEWKTVNGTGTSIRISEVMRCLSDEKLMAMGLAVAEDSFFDYGFYQVRNNTSSVVSLRFKYKSVYPDGEQYEGREIVLLEPGETEKEDLGSWYIGCKILEISIVEYCVYDR